jgi:hypothetical protein
MTRRLLVPALALALIAALAACKGKTTYKDKPETVEALKKLQGQVDADKQLLDAQTQRLADCELAKTTGDEVTITLAGDEIKISGKGPNAQANPDDGAGDAKDAELFAAFLNLVEKSKGSIKKCYQNALKKDARLQAKTIPIKLSASFAASGKITKSNFTPSISETFDGCMRSMASTWKLPAAPKATSFTAPISLTPT